MPIVLFHQNMRTFSGKNADRVLAFTLAFLKTCKAYRGNIKIAGLTEITNNSQDTIKRLLKNLICRNHSDPAPQCLIVNCGAVTTQPEYIAIGVSAHLSITDVGRVAVNHNFNTSSIDTVGYPPTADWCNNYKGQNIGYRSVVYVIVEEVNKPPIAVVFVHNIYTDVDNRISFMQQLPKILDTIASTHYNISNIYIGGDFNCFPIDRKSKIYDLTYYVHFMGPTLNSGNIYDYWHSNKARPVGGWHNIHPRASVIRETLDVPSGLSDHCGIALEIDDFD